MKSTLSRRQFIGEAMAAAAITATGTETGIAVIGREKAKRPTKKAAVPVQNAAVISLVGGWELVDTDIFPNPQGARFDEKTFWEKAMLVEVPRAVQCSLYEKDWIYSGRNSLKTGWILDRQWWYRKHFTVQTPSPWATLTFEGFNYEAGIWLNRTYLGHHQGLYGTELVVDGILQAGDNELIVAIDPAPRVQESDYQMTNQVFHYPSANTKHVMETIIPPSYYERYWGNHIPLGIMRPVKLSQHGPIVLSDLFVRTMEIGNRTARLEFSAGVVNRSGGVVNGNIEWSCDTSSFDSGAIRLHPGMNTFSSDFIINQPRLWWTWDRGNQEMYDLKAWVSASGKQIAENSTRFGIRTIKWQRNDRSEPYQHPDILCLNGKKLYLIGTNLIQTDALGHLPTEIWKEKAMVQMAKHQGINCFRIHETVVAASWDFYRYCDEAGILIFQDCLLNRRHRFAEKTMRKLDITALEDQVVRLVRKLRNNPAIAAWTGGNELYSHTLPTTEDPQTSRLVSNIQENLVKQNDPSRRYFRTCPESAYGEDHAYPFWNYLDYNTGPTSAPWYFPKDPSMLEAWKRLGVDPEEFVKRTMKDDLLITEWLGRPDMPDLSSLKRFVDTAELDDWVKRPSALIATLNSTSPEETNKGPAFFLTQPFLPEAYTLGQSDTLEDFISYTQLARSLVGIFGIGIYRSRMFHNSGNFYFCINDPYPAINFGVVDYYLRPKRGYFDLQQACKRVAGYARYDKRHFESGQVFRASLTVVNAGEREEECVLTAQIWDPMLTLRGQEVQNVRCGGNASVEAGEVSYNIANNKELFFLRVVLETKSRQRSELVYWLNAKGTFRRNDLPSTTLSVKKNNRRLTIKNTGTVPAFRIEIESTGDELGLIPSASGFLLEPTRERVVDLVPMTDNSRPAVFRVKAWNSEGTDFIIA